MLKMDKYEKIINKRINVQLDTTVVNSYKITDMKDTNRFIIGLEGYGKLYTCAIDWENIMEGAHPFLEFDEQTLNGLLQDGFSVCPFMDNLYYVMDGRKIVKPEHN